MDIVEIKLCKLSVALLYITCADLLQHIPNFVVGIHTMGNRVIVADIQESMHFLRYKRAENQLIVFADDTNPRWITASCLLDYDTVACGDKFGNISVVCSSLPSPVV